jgi:hypothetical protein
VLQVAGSKSWVLRFDVGEPPHVALFVRDATGLGALDGKAVDPPRLECAVPDRSALISDNERAQAVSAWQAWWTKIITAQTDPTSQPWMALDSCPSLQNAVRQLHRDACTWFNDQRAPWIPPRRDGHRDWEIAKSAAEAASADRGVPLGDLSADTQLLLVEGNWWRRPTPGVLLYSPSVLADETLIERLRRGTFAGSA